MPFVIQTIIPMNSQIKSRDWANPSLPTWLFLGFNLPVHPSDTTSITHLVWESPKGESQFFTIRQCTLFGSCDVFIIFTVAFSFFIFRFVSFSLPPRWYYVLEIWGSTCYSRRLLNPREQLLLRNLFVSIVKTYFQLPMSISNQSVSTTQNNN